MRRLISKIFDTEHPKDKEKTIKKLARNRSLDFEKNGNSNFQKNSKNKNQNQIFLEQLEKRVINKNGKKRYRALMGSESKDLKTLDDIVVPKRGIKKAEFYLRKISKLRSHTRIKTQKKLKINTSVGLEDKEMKKNFGIVAKRAV